MSDRAARPARRDALRVVAVAVLAVAQLLSAPVTLVLTDQPSTGAVSDDNQSALTPAGYAFTIWGLIYVACLLLGAYQALPAQRHRLVHRRTGWWLALAFAASTVWVPIFGAGALALAQVVILVLVAALAVALARYAGTAFGGWPDRLLVATPVSLYLGWATVASVAGFATTGVSLGVSSTAGWVPGAAVAVLLAVAVLSVWVTSSVPAAVGFAASAAWGLAAIGVAAEGVVSAAALAAATAVGLALVVRVTRDADRVEAAFG